MSKIFSEFEFRDKGWNCVEIVALTKDIQVCILTRNINQPFGGKSHAMESHFVYSFFEFYIQLFNTDNIYHL